MLVMHAMVCILVGISSLTPHSYDTGLVLPWTLLRPTSSSSRATPVLVFVAHRVAGPPRAIATQETVPQKPC